MRTPSFRASPGPVPASIAPSILPSRVRADGIAATPDPDRRRLDRRRRRGRRLEHALAPPGDRDLQRDLAGRRRSLQAQQALVGGTSATANEIDFAIPAAEFGDASDSVAVPGFDPSTQTWTISANSPLPTITHQVTIDGFTPGAKPDPVPLPEPVADPVALAISGGPTGGTFTLTTVGAPPGRDDRARSPSTPAPRRSRRPSRRSSARPPTASTSSAARILPGGSLTIAFTGIDYANESIPPLIPDAAGLIGGIAPTIAVTEVPETDPRRDRLDSQYPGRDRRATTRSLA